MPEESKESKAKKLAAARKKLKEYQQRGTGTMSSAASVNHNADSSAHVSSNNISEISESDEVHLNGSNLEINHTNNGLAQGEDESTPSQLEIVNYFTDATTTSHQEQEAMSSFSLPIPKTSDDEAMHNDESHNINAIQVLITEKAQLTSELNKYRTTFREKELELEEVRVQHSNASRRAEDLQQHLKDQQKQAEQHRLQNAELQHKLAQARAHNEDQSSHLLELQQQMQLREERLKLLDNDFKDKCNELELAQLRVRQLSDENNITKDNRVETLTQTQFMYEQQIRDLQAMVQQLTVDKEQANTQYQTYVQQLNAQVNQLNERNSELIDECSKLQDREKQMVDHVQQLEKEIQKNISRQSELKEEQQESAIPTTTSQQMQELQDRVQEFETERYEFQLKIKSQEDRLHTQHMELQQKQQEVEDLRDHLENVTSEQPDKTKLLATMESDKVAASRALSQNVELKKQLDELELRFVQLTNDKADLMNRLDAEQYANREMHSNYGAMEQRLRDIDERFKFKDEEMIRLSHENEELKKKNTAIQWRLNGEVAQHSKSQIEENDHHEHNDHTHDDRDHHGHGHDHDHHGHNHDHHGHDQDHDHHEHDHDHHGHEHDHHGHDHDHHGHDHDHHGHDHDHDHHRHDHDHHEHDHNHEDNVQHNSSGPTSDVDVGQEAIEAVGTAENRPVTSGKFIRPFSTPHIATAEAVEKLQQRFTQLMSQVADLTEEKQRLEHLVMQLQSETETIGEYIALYQTQRRILKEREYEKAAQTALLQSEREQMRDRLTMLNNLVNSLGMEIPITQQQHQLQQQLNEALAQSITSPELDGSDVSLQQSPTGIVTDPASTIQSTSTNQNNIDGKTTPAYTSPKTIKDFNSLESQQILHKIQNIITEIKENTKELPTVQHSVDHLNCCSGKFEVV